uniref:RxLR effector candidate protein n=1 Tax=Hyaloperonospora arabidopsidis (strain Emoy2) TaxID=559515 RepID=M4BVF6_HYAAE
MIRALHGCPLPNLRLRATSIKRRRPPKSRVTGPLTLGGKSPIVGPRLKGEAFLLLRALREAAQRANRKGGATTQTPRGGGYGNSDCHPSPSTYYSTSVFELLARSPSLTPEPHEANLPRT